MVFFPSLFDVAVAGHRDGILNGVEPVSYTHLDVYKRQGQDLTLVPGFEQAAAENLRRIRTEGARAAFAADVYKRQAPHHPQRFAGAG